MTVRPLFGSLCASLEDFLTKPMSIVGASGSSAVAILDANQPVFYVVSPDAWSKLSNVAGAENKNGIFIKSIKNLNQDAEWDVQSLKAEHFVPQGSDRRKGSVMTESVLTQGAMRHNSFDRLAEELLTKETSAFSVVN